MVFATIVKTASKWKQPKCLLTNEWILKMWYGTNILWNTIQLEKSEIKKFTDKCKELKNMILNEITKTQKDKINIACSVLSVVSNSKCSEM